MLNFHLFFDILFLFLPVPTPVCSYIRTAPTCRAHTKLLHNRVYNHSCSDHAPDLPAGSRHLHGRRGTWSSERFPTDFIKSYATECSSWANYIWSNGPDT